MKSYSIYSRKIHLWFLLSSVIAMIIAIFLMPSFRPIELSGYTMYDVTLNGESVGTVSSEEEAQSDLIEARRKVAFGSDDLICVSADLSCTGRNVLWGTVDRHSDVVNAMADILDKDKDSTLTRCFTLKIGSYMAALASRDDIRQLLSDVSARYDTENQYLVSLVPDTDRQLGCLTAKISTAKEQEVENQKTSRLPIAGINEELDDVLITAEPEVTPDFDDYNLGITSMDFGKKIEIAESYLPASQIRSVSDVESEILKNSEQKQVVEVKAGDTLSQIAENYGLSMDDLLAMNTNYEDENAVIRVGDLITVTVPEPELPVDYTKDEYYEEDYNEDTVYIDNDSWYTTKTEVVQEPSTGHRRVIAEVSYENDTQTGSKILKQQVMTAAVPMIVERGTQTPPTYIWPVSGGYVSSGFGARSAPKKGASTYHKGIDIACSVGTAVMASNGGTVSSAGWQSGYGYVVYIDHGNGVQTRYGHLSKILVSVGEHVSQGERIALSGNTGNSTGPHCHFEIRINGEAVNPLNYLN